MNTVIFWIAAVVAVVSALRVISLRNPIASVLHMIVTLVALAVLFLQLSAEFIAALQVIVYAGAIMVLFLFVVMLLNLKKDEFGHDSLPSIRILGAVICGALLAEFIMILGGGEATVPAAPDGFGSVREIGFALFGDYLLPFELTSVLLLGAALAVIVVARDKTPNDPSEPEEAV
jgi:NADH-quinone oxidoreductase subunit J